MREGNLKDALQFAAQNPNSEFAINLAKVVKSGQVDAQAQQLGIDLTPIKNWNPAGSQPTTAQPNRLQRATDIVTSIFPGEKIGEAIGAKLGKFTVPKEQRQFFDTTAPSAGQIAGDVARVGATIAGAALPGAATIAGKAAQFAGINALSKAGEALTEGQTGEQAAREAVSGAVTGAATGASFGLAGKGFKALGRLLGETGEKIQTAVIKPQKVDIEDGFSIETVKKYNLGGSLKQTLEKTDAKLDDLSKQLNQKLAQSNSSVDMNTVYERTAKRLLGSKLENFGANSQMSNAIEKLREEILTVGGPNGVVSIPEAQIVKRASGHFGAWSYGLQTPEATANQRVYNTFYNELKKAIEDGSPAGVKELNQEISKLIPVMNAVIRRIPVAERNNAISLTDVISLSAASLDPRALSISLINLASKSGRVGNALMQRGPGVGEGAANIAQGAETITRAAMGR